MRETPCPSVSIIIPAYNESESLEELIGAIRSVLACHCSGTAEIVLVNDGSTDGTLDEMQALALSDNRIIICTYPFQRGKSWALQAGFHAASGDIGITMDADLQDDPKHLPDFIAKIREGYDVVTGWKHARKDSVMRVAVSRLFNLLVSYLSSVRLHDFNCGYKAFSKRAYKSLQLRGGMHRLIPAILHWKGYRVAEIPVDHHPRKHGESKYGLVRLHGILDLISLLFIHYFNGRPFHFFGGVGLAAFFLGGFGLVYGSVQSLFGSELHPGTLASHVVLLIVSGFVSVIGLILVSIGFVSELLIQNTYWEQCDQLLKESVKLIKCETSGDVPQDAAEGDKPTCRKPFTN